MFHYIKDKKGMKMDHEYDIILGEYRIEKYVGKSKSFDEAKSWLSESSGFNDISSEDPAGSLGSRGLLKLTIHFSLVPTDPCPENVKFLPLSIKTEDENIVEVDPGDGVTANEALGWNPSKAILEKDLMKHYFSSDSIVDHMDGDDLDKEELSRRIKDNCSKNKDCAVVQHNEKQNKNVTIAPKNDQLIHDENDQHENIQGASLESPYKMRHQLKLKDVIQLTMIIQNASNRRATKLGVTRYDGTLLPIWEKELGVLMGRLAAGPIGSPNKAVDAYSLMCCSASVPRSDCCGASWLKKNKNIMKKKFVNAVILRLTGDVSMYLKWMKVAKRHGVNGIVERDIFLPGDSDSLLQHFILFLKKIANDSDKNSIAAIQRGSWLNCVSKDVSDYNLFKQMLNALCEKNGVAEQFINSLEENLSNKETITYEKFIDLLRKSIIDMKYPAYSNTNEISTNKTCGGFEFFLGLIFNLLEEGFGKIVEPYDTIIPGHGSYAASKWIDVQNGKHVWQAIIDYVKTLPNECLSALNYERDVLGVVRNHNGKEIFLWDADEILCRLYSFVNLHIGGGANSQKPNIHKFEYHPVITENLDDVYHLIGKMGLLFVTRSLNSFNNVIKDSALHKEIRSNLPEDLFRNIMKHSEIKLLVDTKKSFKDNELFLGMVMLETDNVFSDIVSLCNKLKKPTLAEPLLDDLDFKLKNNRKKLDTARLLTVKQTSNVEVYTCDNNNEEEEHFHPTNHIFCNLNSLRFNEASTTELATKRQTNRSQNVELSVMFENITMDYRRMPSGYMDNQYKDSFFQNTLIQLREKLVMGGNIYLPAKMFVVEGICRNWKTISEKFELSGLDLKTAKLNMSLILGDSILSQQKIGVNIDGIKNDLLPLHNYQQFKTNMRGNLLDDTVNEVYNCLHKDNVHAGGIFYLGLKKRHGM